MTSFFKKRKTTILYTTETVVPFKVITADQVDMFMSMIEKMYQLFVNKRRYHLTG